MCSSDLSSYEQLLDLDHLIDLTGQPIESLRELRTKCERAEASISFTRRVLHGRIDIVEHDLACRRDGTGGRGLGDLVEQLPTILADPRGDTSTRSGRVIPAVAAGCVEQELLDAVDAIAPAQTMAGLPLLSLPQVETIRTALRSFEHELSVARRNLHDRIDALQGELAGRYQRGDADLASLAQAF